VTPPKTPLERAADIPGMVSVKVREIFPAIA